MCFEISARGLFYLYGIACRNETVHIWPKFWAKLYNAHGQNRPMYLRTTLTRRLLQNLFIFKYETCQIAGCLCRKLKLIPPHRKIEIQPTGIIIYPTVILTVSCI